MRGISRGFAKTILPVLLCFTLGTPAIEAKTNVSKQPFGNMPDGTAVDVYTLSEGPVEARIITYGGILVSLKAPDKAGRSDDVVLGFDSLDQYVKISNAPEGNPFLAQSLDGTPTALQRENLVSTANSTTCPSITRRILCMVVPKASTMWSGRENRSPMGSSLPT